MIAAGFPPLVKATVVWPTEMGVSVTLVQVSAYRLATAAVVVTASQLYPLPDLEEFTVRPRAANAEPTGDAASYPHVEWTVDDLRAGADVANTTVRTILDNCAANPGTALPYTAVIQLPGRTAGQVNGDLAALTVIVKSDFRRRNWPFRWVPGPQGGSAYTVSADEAQLWQQAIAAPGQVADPVP